MMKTTNRIILTVIALIIAACSTSKKSNTTAVSSTPPIAETPPSPFPFVIAANGVFAPGENELRAIQQQFTETTLEQLNEGYVLYTQGACINCHEAKSIYKRPEEHWKDIIDNMASMAKISTAQKDAVYKYVLAIKATQPK